VASRPLPTDDLEEERRLVESAKAGKLDAMRPIFEKYSGPLYSAVIMPKLGDSVLAEEVLRDTLSTAIQKLDQFEWTGTTIFAWLRQIAVNKAYDLHRKNKRSRKLADAVKHEAQATLGHEAGPTP
jgi:DNA-directed RNA polymerase specialized sigma24 family protein